MRIRFLFIGLMIGFTALAQSSDNNLIIPYLCDNGKYGIADTTTTGHSECIFDSLAMSTSGVTFGVIDDNVHFVNKNGAISTPTPSIAFSAFDKIQVYNRLTVQGRFYSYTKDEITFIYDNTLSIWHGPLTRPVSKEMSHLGYYGDFMYNPQPFVFFTKGKNQFVLSSIGMTKELSSNKAESYNIKDNYLFYIGDNGDKSIIYNMDLEEELVADTILFPVNYTSKQITAKKDGKRYKVKTNKIFNMENVDLQSSITFEEIPITLKWEYFGYSYHKSGPKKWIEDKDGDVYYTLGVDEMILPYSDNILSYRGKQKKFLIGDSSLRIRQPHISFAQVGNKFLFQDSIGFHVLDRTKRLHSAEIYLDAHRVDKDLLWVEYQDSKRALLDKDLEVILLTKEDIVKVFIGRTYIYQVDSLYGLLDSIGNRITPPLSTQSDFYTSPKLEWIKIDQGKRAYIYNVFTKRRTEGLSNEFRFSDKHHDVEGNNLISSTTYGIDSTYFYRQDGSTYEVLARKESQHFQKEKHRYTRKEITRDNYIYIDQLHSDTLLICNDCDGMYLIDMGYYGTVQFVVCSYRKLRKDLYNKRGERLLPAGMSMLRNVSMDNELAFYPQIIVQQDEKIGVFDVEEQKVIIPIQYDNVVRLHRDRLSLRTKGKNQITDLNGTPINDELYYRTHELKNGDVAAQFPMVGTHKKRVYRDENNPDIDPCEGTIVDVPNYYYKIIDKNGKSRFDMKFIKYEYETDDLISVSERTDKDTIHYCMNIQGEKLKTTDNAVNYAPYYQGVIELRENYLSTFVDKNLSVLVDRKFKNIGRQDNEDGNVFYYGSDSIYTYVYNQEFEEKTKALGKLHLGRFGTTMMFLNNYDNRDVWLLNMDGSPFYKKVIQGVGRNHYGGIQAYRKDGMSVYVDLLRARKYWD